jgi:hypothetical protein
MRLGVAGRSRNPPHWFILHSGKTSCTIAALVAGRVIHVLITVTLRSLGLSQASSSTASLLVIVRLDNRRFSICIRWEHRLVNASDTVLSTWQDDRTRNYIGHTTASLAQTGEEDRLPNAHDVSLLGKIVRPHSHTHLKQQVSTRPHTSPWRVTSSRVLGMELVENIARNDISLRVPHLK